MVGTPALPHQAKSAALVVAAVVFSAVVGMGAANPSLLRVSVVLVLVALLAQLCVRTPHTVAILLLLGLAGLGLARRLAFGAGASTDFDPLLLVAPLGVILLVLVVARRGAFSGLTGLGRAVLYLAAALALGALNPLQGGIAVGLAGLFFLLIPVLWFFIARVLFDGPRSRRLLQGAVVVGFLSALYGLYQTYVGFPAFDEAYVAERGYQALQVGSVIRAFGPFTAASEYAAYLGCAIVVVLAVLKPRHLLWAAPVLFVLGWALFVESSRGIVVTTMVAGVVIVFVRRGLSPVVVLPFAVVSLFGLSALAGVFVDQYEVDAQGVDGLIRHQLEGLSDPLGERSTLEGHNERFLLGLGSVVTRPLGSGTGAVTIASGKFGGQGAGTEKDLSNVAVALGLPGLVIFTFVLILGLRDGYRLARWRRDWVAVAALGILVALGQNWLNGNNYAVAPLVWTALGIIDARTRQAAAEAEEEAVLTA